MTRSANLPALDELTNHVARAPVEESEDAPAVHPGAVFVVFRDRRFRAAFTGARPESRDGRPCDGRPGVGNCRAGRHG
ncbi:hypothetical protein ACIHCQ_33195 [Streptomyces sp. NPDC052236]|uniref:hypothetical protein n=1 Tax=Streptomyces sp. NPDC052236 TaxID=3365686 RepID=UPI0037D5302D